MRIRYEIYNNGIGTGTIVECDLPDKKAIRKFTELKNNFKCGWGELVGEEEHNYMDILSSFNRIETSKIISSISR